MTREEKIQMLRALLFGKTKVSDIPYDDCPWNGEDIDIVLCLIRNYRHTSGKQRSLDETSAIIAEVKKYPIEQRSGESVLLSILNKIVHKYGLVYDTQRKNIFVNGD